MALDDRVAVIKSKRPQRPEEVGGMTLVELLVNEDREISHLAQEIVKLLLSERPHLKISG